MYIKDINRKEPNRFLRTIVACLVFVAANAIDYLMTVSGIITNTYQEGNPIVQYYIDLFGVYNGVLICKLLISSLVILGLLIYNLKYKKEARKIKPEYFLYSGSVLMLIAGILWL